MALGIKGKQNTVFDAVKYVSGQAMTQALQAAAAIRDVVKSGNGDGKTPKYRPVVQSSTTTSTSAVKTNINNNSTNKKTTSNNTNTTNNNQNGIIKETTNRINTSINKANEISSAIAMNIQIARAAMHKDEIAMLNELRGVKSQIRSLGSDMRSMKLYLDSDRLVGGILPKVDKGLAQRHTAAGRMN